MVAAPPSRFGAAPCASRIRRCGAPACSGSAAPSLYHRRKMAPCRPDGTVGRRRTPVAAKGRIGRRRAMRIGTLSILLAAVPRGGRRGRPRAGAAVHAGHPGDAARSGSGRLDQLAAHPGRVGLQPPGPDRHGERAPAAARLVVGHRDRGPARAEPAGLRRRALHRQPVRHRRGARRGHRGAAVALPARARGRGADRHRHHPQPRHLRRQGVPDHRRCAHRGARRPDGRRRLERRRRRLPARVPLHRRPHRRRRQGDSQHERLRALPRGEGDALLHLRAGRADRRGGLAHVDRRPAGRARAATRGATPR